jgi:hypothetical protein
VLLCEGAPGHWQQVRERMLCCPHSSEPAGQPAPVHCVKSCWLADGEKANVPLRQLSHGCPGTHTASLGRSHAWALNLQDNTHRTPAALWVGLQFASPTG